MTADSRIEALEKKVAEQGEQIKDLVRALSYTGGGESAYQSAILALLLASRTDRLLDDTLAQMLRELDANTISSAGTEEQLTGFEAARELIEEARTRGRSASTLPA